MEAVKESLKRRAEGSRRAAQQKDEFAALAREEAARHTEEAAELRAEADELDRVRIAMYGASEGITSTLTVKIDAREAVEHITKVLEPGCILLPALVVSELHSQGIVTPKALLDAGGIEGKGEQTDEVKA